MLEQEQESSNADLQNLRAHLSTTSEYLNNGCWYLSHLVSLLCDVKFWRTWSLHLSQVHLSQVHLLHVHFTLFSLSRAAGIQ